MTRSGPRPEPEEGTEQGPVARMRHLVEAMAGRSAIGQAQGMLMARHGITAEQALDRLREQSRLLDRSVHRVAADLVNGWGESSSNPREDRLQPDAAIHLDPTPSARQSPVGSSVPSGSAGGPGHSSGDEAWQAHDELFVELDDRQRRRVRAALSVSKGGTIDRVEVEDLIERTLGRITFEEYLQRGRDRRRS